MRRGPEDPRYECARAWAHWHVRVQTALIVFENVVGFDTDVLHEWFGNSYNIFIHIIEPADVGWGCCKRPRIYAAMVHKSLHMLADPVAVFKFVSAALRGNAADLRVRDLLVAPAREIAGELLQLARARGTRLSSFAGGGVNMADCILSPWEMERLHHYRHLWSGRRVMGTDLDLVVNLGQSPAAGFVNWSAPAIGSTKAMLPTLRKCHKLMWCPQWGRWMAVGELAVAMGFPCYQSLLHQLGLPHAFCPGWDERNLLGNSMHLACVGVWQACVAACIKAHFCSGPGGGCYSCPVGEFHPT